MAIRVWSDWGLSGGRSWLIACFYDNSTCNEASAMGAFESLIITSSYYVAFGGFADIYSGILRLGGKEIPVAIKILRGKMTRKDMARFYREAVIWGTLKHEGILPLYGVAPNVGPQKALGMISPWIDKGNLTYHLENHPQISLEGRISILIQVAAAVQYLHSLSIIHGDLTGNNILMKDDKNILLCDFGLSRIWMDNVPTLHTTSIGKCNYPWAAPEVIFNDNPNEPPFTKSSDVYSFGCVMVQVLTGHLPYPTKNVIYHHLTKSRHPPRPTNTEFISDELWEFMLWCWAGIPSDRPSMEEVSAFLTSHVHDF
ncbi:kinase-like domain-containing protein [Collybia nuda]|uniref:Kinase-like domain-containing protein n=1 Tax=Collybia nuda TaxID=64659 RepID=A0A9P5XY30_9AGAR|nr:kinase-like domain-containing protein [Collybia nuda]